MSIKPSMIHDSDKTILVEFEDGDLRNPVNFSAARKWAITIISCMFTGIASANVSSYTMGVPTMVRDLHCTTFSATVGFGVFLIGFGIVPLFTSSLSEELGRFPLYIVTIFLFFLMHVVIALAPNIETVVIARFLSGSFGSTGAVLVGGIVADIWKPDERGFPMALFAIAGLGSSGLGPLFAGFIESNDHLGWRWIQWISTIVTGVYFLGVLLVLTETRSDIILTRLARKMRQVKQDSRYSAKAEIDQRSLLMLIKVSSTRPIILLFTEPAVLSYSLWIGFTWGVMFCFVDSISGEMARVYNFSIVERGLTYVCITIGGILGWIANMYQEVLYKKYAHKKGPEARLYLALVAAVLLPAGMLIYAWTTRTSIHWIVPLVGLTIFNVGAFIIYQCAIVYIADCYGSYASSALAGQSMCRNVLGGIFPLFAQQMYAKLSYEWANTLFAVISVAMIPIPFMLFMYGAAIRKRGRVSRTMLALVEEKQTSETGAETETETEKTEACA